MIQSLPASELGLVLLMTKIAGKKRKVICTPQKGWVRGSLGPPSAYDFRLTSPGLQLMVNLLFLANKHIIL
jgi:hypothetical protein